MLKRFFPKKKPEEATPANVVRVVVYDINGVLDYAGTGNTMYGNRMTGRPNHKLLKRVEELRDQGIPQYVATNMMRVNALPVYNKHKDAFQDLITSDTKGFECKKADPQYFLNLYDRLKEDLPDLKPSEILFLDDKMDNVLAARSVGWLQAKHYALDLDTEQGLQEMLDRCTLMPANGLEQGAP